MLAVDFNTEIVYDRITKDFNLFVAGEYVGSAPTYGEGRYRLDAIVLDKLTHSHPSAVNWSDRPDFADPPGTDPAPETGLGSSDEEGDDPDA